MNLDNPSQSVTLKTPRLTHNFNPFDEFGLMLSLKRNRGEKNFDYRKRLLDVGHHRPAANVEGLLNAISRDISIRPHYESVKFTAGTTGDSESTPFVDSVPYLEIAQTGLFYDSDTLILEETLVADPVDWTLPLSEFPRYEDDVVLWHGTTQIPVKSYEVYPVDKLIRFTDDTYAGESIKLQYNYRKYFAFYTTWPTCITINELKILVDAFRTKPLFVSENGDTGDQVTALNLNGLAIATSTDASGNVYLTLDLDPSTSRPRVRLYKDTARTEDDMIASGVLPEGASATAGTIQLAACNSSGVTGSIYVSYGAGSSSVSFTYQLGYKYINMEVDSYGGVVGREPAYKLMPVPPVLLGRSSLDITAYPVRLLELWDPFLKDLIENQYGHMYNTCMEGWARKIGAKANIKWEGCVLDQDHWDIFGRRSMDVLPHIYDAVPVRFFPSDPTDTDIYKHAEFVFYGGYAKEGVVRLNRDGTKNSDFKSGSGSNSDLKVVDLVEEEISCGSGTAPDTPNEYTRRITAIITEAGAYITTEDGALIAGENL